MKENEKMKQTNPKQLKLISRIYWTRACECHRLSEFIELLCMVPNWLRSCLQYAFFSSHSTSTRLRKCSRSTFDNSSVSDSDTEEAATLNDTIEQMKNMYLFMVRFGFLFLFAWRLVVRLKCKLKAELLLSQSNKATIQTKSINCTKTKQTNEKTIPSAYFSFYLHFIHSN